MACFFTSCANGARYWRLKYRYMGKEKVLALGVYPEVSLAEARAKRDAARKQLEAHIDPSLAKKQEKHIAAISAETTFEVVAREWHDTNIEKWTPTYAKELIHRLETDVFPMLGFMPIGDIAAPMKILCREVNTGPGSAQSTARQYAPVLIGIGVRGLVKSFFGITNSQ